MYEGKSKYKHLNEAKHNQIINDNILKKQDYSKNHVIYYNHKIKKKSIDFYYINSFILIFILMFIQIYSSKALKIKALSFSYEITIKMKGNGTQPILVGGQVPNRIYLNDNSTALAGDKVIHNLESETNTIRMVWDSSFSNFKGLFSGLYNILEIDFSNFDSSQVENMEDMFYGCSSLTSINFSNFNTKSVTSMRQMFSYCSGLTSLDLSNFDTSSVISMYKMFGNCQNLKILNLTSFETKKVDNMREMFSCCERLETLDLSSFNTSSVNVMIEMFLNCRALTSLDLSNFDTSSVTSMAKMFSSCQNLKVLNLTSFDTKKVDNMREMFSSCDGLETLDLSSFDTSSVTEMVLMFLYCRKLKSLDLSNFNTSSVTDFSEMFKECNKLENLDISNFQTSQITSMGNMFFGCNTLKSLNLSHFDTSKVIYLDNMFGWCNSLETLDIRNFDTSSAQFLNNMFGHCEKLTSLNLTHFNTSKVRDINHMFDSCISLISIELGNFDTTSVINMEYMFYGCRSLISLNLNSFTSSESLTSFQGMFNEVLITLKYCINDKILEEIKSQLSSFNQLNCSDLCSEFLQSKYIPDKNKCILNCTNDDTFNYEYKNVCFISCPNGTHQVNDYLCEEDLICHNYYNYERTECLDEIPLGYYLNDTINKTLDKCNIKCSNCTKESMSEGLCISCNNVEGYYQKENDELNENSFLNCYKGELLGYYLDEVEKKYSPCFSVCKNCSGRGDSENHNCLECFSDLILNSNGNCENPVEEVPTTYADTEVPTTYADTEITTTYADTEITTTYADTEITTTYAHTEITTTYADTEVNEETNPVTTTINEENIENDSTESLTNTQETNPDTTIANEETNENDSSESFPDTEEFTSSNTITESDELSSALTNNFTNNIINVPEVSNKSIYSYHIDLNSPNSKQNYKNVTFIDFSPKEVEYIYNKFNLDKEKDKIYALISDYINDDPGMATRDYKLKLFLENGTEINLSIIDDDFYLDFYVPIDNLNTAHFNDAKDLKDQGYDIYDKNSDFYHDFCSPAFLGENDITLKDRRKYIYPNNVSLCKENCNYNGVELEDERVICSCNLNSNKSYADNEDNNFIEEDGNFLSYFLDNINYNVFKCYNLISSFGNLKNNYAFWTILGVTIVLITINLIFYLYTIPFMKKSMLNNTPTSEKVRNQVIQELLRFRSTKENNTLLNQTKKESTNHNPTKKKKKTKIKKSTVKINTESLMSSLTKKNSTKKKIKVSRKISAMDFTPYKKNQRKETIKIIRKKKPFKTVNKITNKKEDLPSPSVEKLIPRPEEEIINDEKIKSYSNEVINELPYNQAIIIDKRNIFKIWSSLLITKLELINIFCSKSAIKIILIGEYILSLLINFFFNTLLYSDEVVSQKYHNNGELDIIVTLVLSLLSNIITSIICFYIKYSKGLEERSDLIMEIKLKKYYIKNVNTFFKYLRIKFICFFFAEMVIIACCYYYIVIFCIIYSQSKGSLMVNYLTSLVEGLITSVAISIIILVTRSIGLFCLNKYFYNISKYINTRF